MVPTTDDLRENTATAPRPTGPRVLLRIPDLDATRSSLTPLTSLMPPKIAAKATSVGDFLKRLTSRILLATVTISAIVLFFVAVQGLPGDKGEKGDKSKGDTAKSVTPIPAHPHRNATPAATRDVHKPSPSLAPDQPQPPFRGPQQDRTADRRANVTEPARREVFSYQSTNPSQPATEPLPGSVQFGDPVTPFPTAPAHGQH